jgi:thiamine biosynthesis protein ThiS
MITITVNGQRRQLKGPTSLPEFLETLGVRVKFMAVAHNGEVLRKEEYPKITLRDGDTLELVRPVGGGSEL